MKYTVSDWMRSEQQRRQDLFTDVFCGRPVDHIPLEIRVSDDRYSVRTHFFGKEEEWLQDSLRAVEKTWELGEYTDAIPAFCADVGCSCIANAFGSEYVFLGGEDQTPSIKEKLIEDIEEQIDDFSVPDLSQAYWIQEGLRRMRICADLGQGFTPQCGLDAAGGLNVASDLMGTSELLIALLTAPEEAHKLLQIIQKTYLSLIDLEIDACGGIENLTTTDFYAGWAPMGFKGHCSDDISAMIAPHLYKEFSLPYHAMVYQKYGCGGLHNCGPNPCHSVYMDGLDTPVYLDLNEIYSRKDLAVLKESLRGRGFIRWGSDNRDIDSIVAEYTGFMELLAPDVMLIPTYTFQDPADGIALYKKLLPIAKEYAKRMNFQPFVRNHLAG